MFDVMNPQTISSAVPLTSQFSFSQLICFILTTVDSHVLFTLFAVLLCEMMNFIIKPFTE